jgi:predicted aspartyl protease
MPKVLLLFCCSSLLGADFDQLLENHRFFDLRRELAQAAPDSVETLFYRGVMECRFGEENSGIRKLQQVLATNPSLALGGRSHEEMAWAFERLGHYKEAAEQWAEALRSIPKDASDYSEDENTGLLMSSLSDAPPQTVDFGEAVSVHATRNRLGTWDVPVEVNHVQGGWIFDTGADQSTITESEAKRMGLTVVETKAYVSGCCAGEKNKMRLAVARDLQFGGAQVHNVVLLVLPDESLNLRPLHYQITGILGIPVMRALGTVAISSDGLIRMHESRTAVAETPNLFFDGEEKAVVETSHNQHLLQVVVDTGANDTTLYPSFRDAMTREEVRKLQKRRETRAGAGGSVRRRVQGIPSLRLDLFDKPVTLKKISLEPEAPPNSHHDGVIGMDAFWGGFRVDFDSMRLELD